MRNTQSGFKTFFFFWLMVGMFSFTTLYASENTRIEEENASPMPEIPLKQAIGEAAYNDAMKSGMYRYVGNTKCRLCHRNFFIGRKQDPHDYAMEAIVKSGNEANARCLRCHTTGHGVDSGFVSMESTPRLANVQCEGCHGPGNVHIKMIKEKRHGGGFLAGSDRPERLVKMCTGCHTERWNRSYHDLPAAYNKYRNADPNSAKKSNRSQ